MSFSDGSREMSVRGKGARGLGRACDFGGRRMRADFPAMLGHAARRRTRFVRYAHCAQTAAASQMTKRAARAATCPALLGASHARPAEPARAFAEPASVLGTCSRIGRASSAVQLRGRRSPAGAISAATSSAGPRSARAQRALRHLTHRGCLSAVSVANEASSAMRPRAEQRSGVDAQRRPPQCEPWPETACREARSMRPRVVSDFAPRAVSASHPSSEHRCRAATWPATSNGGTP